jgi:nicotinamide-nucleotide adenylyltransferase
MGYPCTRVALPADQLGRVGMIARWKPVHRGHAAVLRALAARADALFLGIGSSNRLNARNPFTAAETRGMLELVLGHRSNVTLLEVPDLDDGPRWRALVVELLGPLDAFVTANPCVAGLLAEHYTIVHPVDLVPPEERVRIDGTRVRREMARGEGWRTLVPDEVAVYVEERGLDRRFRKEFGLETLALDVPPTLR